jgi:multiple sugar transport system substrate-binding protein
MTTLSRRRFLTLSAAGALGVGAAGTLAACGGRSASASGELTVQIWDPNQEAGVRAAIDAFAASDAGVPTRLDLIPEGQYYTKLDASLGAGAGPDVMWQSSKVPDYVAGGALEPLDDYITDAGIDMSAYIPAITSLYNIDGHQYGIPKDVDTFVVIYNARLFAEHGVAEPSPEWTWEEMLDVSQQLLDASGWTGAIGSFRTDLNASISDIAQQLGGGLVSEDGKTATLATEPVEEAVQRLLDLVEAGFAPDLSQKADYDALSSLIAGNLFFAVIPSWDLTAVAGASEGPDHFKAVRLPSVDGSFVSNTNGLAYTLNAHSQRKDEAFALIRSLTSVEGASAHAAAGAGLPAIPAAQDAWFEANSSIGRIETVREAAGNLYLRTTTRVPKSRPGMDKIETIVMPPMWAGTLPVADALEQANTMMQEALDS